ncbi:MAG: hypothetical protein FWD11_08215 [Micrococcales bacterium]|nr:hypothetical protein [Micrococcales bacterium]
MSDQYLQPRSEPTPMIDVPWGTPEPWSAAEPRATEPWDTDEPWEAAEAEVTDEPWVTGAGPRPAPAPVPASRNGAHLSDPVVLREKKDKTSGQLLDGLRGVLVGVALFLGGVAVALTEPEGAKAKVAVFLLVLGVAQAVAALVRGQRDPQVPGG